ncbi:MAG TPA: AAA family ATPase, partial [Phycisphaerales bacterium]|nr:AAA family ATPase [Phycisphaerales bacterium]
MTGPTKPNTQPLDLESAAREVTEAHGKLKSEIHKIIVGQDQVLDEVLAAVFCGGHALVVGVPGLA